MANFGVVTFELDGQVRRLDMAAVPTSEWKVVQAHTGLKPLEVMTQFGNIEVAEALYWLAARRAGEHFEIGTKDFPLFEFIGSLKEVPDQTAKTEPAAEEDGSPKGSASPKGGRKSGSDNG